MWARLQLALVARPVGSAQAGAVRRAAAVRRAVARARRRARAHAHVAAAATPSGLAAAAAAVAAAAPLASAAAEHISTVGARTAVGPRPAGQARAPPRRDAAAVRGVAAVGLARRLAAVGSPPARVALAVDRQPARAALRRDARRVRLELVPAPAADRMVSAGLQAHKRRVSPRNAYQAITNPHGILLPPPRRLRARMVSPDRNLDRPSAQTRNQESGFPKATERASG